MRDRDLYATILGLRDPWLVQDVELDAEQEIVRVPGLPGGVAAS